MKLLLFCSFLSVCFSIHTYANDQLPIDRAITQESNDIITISEMKKAKRDAERFLDTGKESARLTRILDKLESDNANANYSRQELAALILFMTL